MNKEIKEKPHTHVVIIFLTVLALTLSIISFAKPTGVIKKQQNTEIETFEDVSYNIYVGLTDKNANYQTIEEDVAIELIKTICVNYGAAYTIYQVQGGHKDAGGVLHAEKTIKLEMDRISEETLYEVLNDIKKRLNVQSIMVLKQPIEVFNY